MDTKKLFDLGVDLMKAQANNVNAHVAVRKATHPECQECQSDDPMMPNHNGSSFCECGSIASGGTKSHCTCDNCY